jgi:hypothetical protein
VPGNGWLTINELTLIWAALEKLLTRTAIGS